MLDAAAVGSAPWNRGRWLMARDWRCLIGRHDWREVEIKKPDRDKYAECTRCGKHDWQRLITKQVGAKWRGGSMPPGGDSGGI